MHSCASRLANSISGDVVVFSEMPPKSKKEGKAWTKNVTKIQKVKIQQLQQTILPSRAPARKVPLLPGQAASKIQAGFKGMKARREVKEFKKQNNAAVTIQANFKGMKAPAGHCHNLE